MILQKETISHKKVYTHMYTMIGYTQPQLKISTTFLIAFIHIYIYVCVNIKYIYIYIMYGLYALFYVCYI